MPEILAKANAEAQKMIEEARASATHLADRKQQEAIAAAEQILAKAREASAIEHERTMEATETRTRAPGCGYDGQSHRESFDAGRSTTSAGGSGTHTFRLIEDKSMQVKKEVRQIAREMLRASFTDGQLDRGRIASLVDSILAKKPRNYLKILEYYKRLLRLEAEKRHARIETASDARTRRSPRRSSLI